MDRKRAGPHGDRGKGGQSQPRNDNREGYGGGNQPGGNPNQGHQSGGYQQGQQPRQYQQGQQSGRYHQQGHQQSASFQQQQSRGHPRQQQQFQRPAQVSNPPVFVVVSNAPPYKNEPDQRPPVPEAARILKWKDLNETGKIQLPKRHPKDPGAEGTAVTLTVNHFPLAIKLPKTLYLYRVDVERVREEAASSSSSSSSTTKTKEEASKKTSGGKKKGKRGAGGGDGDPAAGTATAGTPTRLPTDLMKKIMICTLKQMWLEAENYKRKSKIKIGIASDFSHALYTTGRLEESDISMERVIPGSLPELGSPEDSDCSFIVRISQTVGMIDTTGLGFDLNNLRFQELDDEANGQLVNLERVYSTVIRCVELNTYTPMRRMDLINFSRADLRHPLGGGVVSYPGFSVLLPLANGWKPFLNVEIANLATYLNEHVFTVIKNVLGDRSRAIPEDITTWKTFEFDKISDLLKTCKVTYSPSAGKVFTKVVVKVLRQSVSQAKFDFNGRQVSVSSYFASQYGIRLTHPNGPCLECKGGNKPIIPAELCSLKKGQSYNRKLDENQVREIAKKAKLDPWNLQPAIQRAVDFLKLKNNNSVLESFGVEMASEGQMHSLEARVIAPPSLVYGIGQGENVNKNAVITPQDGEWDIWSTNFQFYRNATVSAWGVLNLAVAAFNGPNMDQCLYFADALAKKARMRNMNLPKPAYEELNLRDEQYETNVKQLKETFKKFGLTGKNGFVLVVIPKKGCQVYNQAKQAAELEVGVLTQCVTAQSVQATGGRFQSILGNILLKINSKLTHVNHVVMLPTLKPSPKFPIFCYPTMIIGADVTHPPPGSTTYEKDANGEEVPVGPPSFAAVTASICRTGMPFMMHIQAQRKAKKGAAEVIQGFELIMCKFLDKYYAFTGAYPVKILYFRDGVGEGQFQEVLRTEMTAIRQACTRWGASKGIAVYEPKITFVTVQKRHKTRFFLQTNDGAANAEPGTVVDTDIVHPVEKDFYLLSHKGVRGMGTCRPTRYHVLWDDSDFSLGHIQTMAYFLCYMFVRCNRSVKIPAPTYYAHWAAKRAEILSKGWIEPFNRQIDGVERVNERLSKRETQADFASIYPMHFV